MSKKILVEQQRNKWPGLSAEVREICSELKISDMNNCEVPVGIIKRAIMDHHDRHLVDDVSNSKKMKKHKEDNFKEVQDYMKGKVLYNSRMAFRIRCEMVTEIKGNCKDKYRRRGGGFEM